MRVAIIGSRDCRHVDFLKLADFLPQDCTVIISGGAAGIDSLAEQLAAEKRIPLVKYLPDYTKHGIRAPLLRNLQIVENCDLLLAFWDCHSRGTAFTINACIERNVPVRIIPLGFLAK